MSGGAKPFTEEQEALLREIVREEIASEAAERLAVLQGRRHPISAAVAERLRELDGAQPAKEPSLSIHASGEIGAEMLDFQRSADEFVRGLRPPGAA